jgi:hypothetical protein
MNRTFVRDFQQFGSLLARQRTNQLNLALDPIDSAFSGFTLGTVGGMNLRMPKRNHYLLQRPTLSSRKQRDRHRRATAQRSQKQIVGRQARVCPAGVDRLVSRNLMPTSPNCLGKSSCTPANSYVRLRKRFSHDRKVATYSQDPMPSNLNHRYAQAEARNTRAEF